jgi:hypothetical protein
VVNLARGHEGFLDRKCLLEGGQESKKRAWQTYYATLAGRTLYFFKDEKDKKKGKKPVHFFNIINSSLTSADHLTKRTGTFVLGTAADKLALQPKSPTDISTWAAALVQAGSTATSLDFVHGVNGQLLAPGGAAAPHPEEKLGTKPKKYGGIKQRLNKYLRSRPTKDDLKAKGVIADACFGGTIAAQVAFERENYDPESLVSGVPLVVSKCVQVVEQYLDELGIYRVSGNSSHIQALSLECNADVGGLDLHRTNDVNNVTGLMKLYFRELADPVFTDRLYPEFLAAAKTTDKALRLKKFRDLFDQLPVENQATLRYVIVHLHKVISHEEKNKMRANNVAIVFGPTLLRLIAPTSTSIIMDTPYQSSIVEEIMREFDTFK